MCQKLRPGAWLLGGRSDLDHRPGTHLRTASLIDLHFHAVGVDQKPMASAGVSSAGDVAWVGRFAAQAEARLVDGGPLAAGRRPKCGSRKAFDLPRSHCPRRTDRTRKTTKCREGKCRCAVVKIEWVFTYGHLLQIQGGDRLAAAQRYGRRFTEPSSDLTLRRLCIRRS